MNPADSTPQDDWENNVYLLSTTRVLMALGLTFLIRSVYKLFQMMRSPGGNAGALEGRAEEATGIDLEALALGALGDAAMFSSEPMDSINETLEVTLPQPQPTYSPQARTSPRSVPPRQNSTAAS